MSPWRSSEPHSRADWWGQAVGNPQHPVAVVTGGSSSPYRGSERSVVSVRLLTAVAVPHHHGHR